MIFNAVYPWIFIDKIREYLNINNFIYIESIGENNGKIFNFDNKIYNKLL